MHTFTCRIVIHWAVVQEMFGFISCDYLVDKVWIMC